MDWDQLLYVSDVANIMSLLVVIVGSIVAAFSWNYLQGDDKKTIFYIHLLLLQGLMLGLVYANNIVLFVLCWLFGNIVIVRMMIHRSSWDAAYHGAMYVATYLFFGWGCLLTGFFLLYRKTHITTLYDLKGLQLASWADFVPLLLLLIAAMIQGAVIPMHRWLLNSLNAPTPVSACMHAGLIGAGPLLLIKLAPLYIQSSLLLHVIFSIGIITSILGVAFKLIQPNVKRMLACSTIAQMGFVFVQCGLGFFTAAFAHIFWHGLFKTYLFLSSATLEDERDVNVIQMQSFTIIVALVCGCLSSFGFMYVQGFSSFFSTTIIGLLIVAFIAGMQLALTILQSAIFADIFIACLAAISLGVIYGLIDVSIHRSIALYNGMHPQQLTFVYCFGLIVLIIPWICMLYIDQLQRFNWFRKFYAYVYVWLLRATQSTNRAITIHKNRYHYRKVTDE